MMSAQWTRATTASLRNRRGSCVKTARSDVSQHGLMSEFWGQVAAMLDESKSHGALLSEMCPFQADLTSSEPTL